MCARTRIDMICLCAIDADAQLNTHCLSFCLSACLSLCLLDFSPPPLQVATLGANCKAVADSKYNIAELLESYVADDDVKSGKHRARAFYLEAEQVYV